MPFTSAIGPPLGALLALACAVQVGACQVTGDRPRVQVAVVVKALTQCPMQGVGARLLLPGQQTVCPLSINAAADAFEGSCEVEPGADVAVTLEYFVEAASDKELLLARAQRRTDIEEGENSIAFAIDDLSTSFDEDSDGLVNIDEHCLGRDPSTPDAPTIDELASEPGSVVASSSRYAVGERIKILGDNLPGADQVKVTVGPLASGENEVELQPRAVTSGAIEVQLPAGLDLSADVTLTIEIFGERWTRQLSVVRLWAYARYARSEVRLLAAEAGGHYDALKQEVRQVCLGSSCTVTCLSWLHDVSSDGRYLVAHCPKQENAAPQPVHLLELPTAEPWPGTLPAFGPTTAVRWVLGDRYLAFVEPGSETLSFRRFDAAERSLGTAEQVTTIAGATAMTVNRARDAVYVWSATEHRAYRYALAEVDGQLQVEAPTTVALDAGCDPSATGCILPLAPSLAAVGTHRLAIARSDGDRLDLVDFETSGHRSISIDQPFAVAATSDGAALFVSTADPADAGIGLCHVLGWEAAAAASCEYLPNSATPNATAISVSLMPGDEVGLMTSFLSLLQVPIRIFDVQPFALRLFGMPLTWATNVVAQP